MGAWSVGEWVYFREQVNLLGLNMTYVIEDVEEEDNGMAQLLDGQFKKRLSQFESHYNFKAFCMLFRWSWIMAGLGLVSVAVAFARPFVFLLSPCLHVAPWMLLWILNVAPSWSGAALLQPGKAPLRPGVVSLPPTVAHMRPAVIFLRPGASHMWPGAATLRPGAAPMRPGTAPLLFPASCVQLLVVLVRLGGNLARPFSSWIFVLIGWP
ncbi:hypothetical protein R6Q59_025235 [Mikania micrantha]